MVSPNADDGAATKIVERLTHRFRRIGRAGFWLARFRGKADGVALVSCSACKKITSRQRALEVAAAVWGCGPECADQIAAEQGW